MTDDIVERLREEGFVTHMAKLPRESKLLHAAADEIERLREEITALHESHGNEVGALKERLSLAIRKRDSARAEVCFLRTCPTSVSDTVTQSMADYAKSRGWLFREEQ